MRVRFCFIANSFWMGCAVLTVLIPRLANAAEWSVQPSVRLGWERNDNPLLTPQPHESVSGTMIAPKLDVGVASDVWTVSGGVEAVQKRFSRESSLDRDDRNYNVSTSYQTERSTWQLAGSRSRSAVISDEQINPDTGVVEVQKVYDSKTLSPSWTWAMNELTQLQIAYSFNSVSYVDGESVGLNDYSTRGVTAQLTRSLNLRSQVFFSVGYSILDIPATTLDSQSGTYQAGFTQSFSETLSGTVVAGTRKTSNEQVGTVCTVFLGQFCVQAVKENQFTKQTSAVFNGSLEKKFETGKLSLTVSRSFDPSGLGGEVRTDTQNIEIRNQFTTRMTGSFSAANYTYRAETDNLSDVDRHLYIITPGLFYTLTKELSVNLNYQYRHIKRASEDQPGSGNTTYLTLRYQWPKMTFSR
jgi:hypothetical protein